MSRRSGAQASPRSIDVPIAASLGGEVAQAEGRPVREPGRTTALATVANPESPEGASAHELAVLRDERADSTTPAAAALSRDHAAAAYRAAYAAMNQGRTDEAIEGMQDAVRLEGRDKRALVCRQCRRVIDVVAKLGHLCVRDDRPGLRACLADLRLGDVLVV